MDRLDVSSVVYCFRLRFRRVLLLATISLISSSVVWSRQRELEIPYRTHNDGSITERAISTGLHPRPTKQSVHLCILPSRKDLVRPWGSTNFVKSSLSRPNVESSVTPSSISPYISLLTCALCEQCGSLSSRSANSVSPLCLRRTNSLSPFLSFARGG